MASTSGEAAPSVGETAATAPALDEFSPEQLTMAEAALRAVLTKRVQALAAEHGDAFIQSLVQKEITKTKRMEADLASVKKQLGAQERVVDEARAEVRKVRLLEDKAKYLCQGLQDATKKREQLTEKMEAEMEAYRTDVQQRVNQNVQNILTECENRRQRVEETEAEVAELEATLEEKKTAFEQSFAQFQDGLKGRTAEFQELILTYQKATSEVETLEAKLMLVQRERNSVELARAALQQQAEVYEKQFDEFANSVMKPDDVEAVAQRQRDQAQVRIAQMEEDKTQVHQQRLQMDKELIDLRAKHATLKRELQQLEKTKTAAEKKCRQAQQSRQEKK